MERRNTSGFSFATSYIGTQFWFWFYYCHFKYFVDFLFLEILYGLRSRLGIIRALNFITISTVNDVWLSDILTSVYLLYCVRHFGLFYRVFGVREYWLAALNEWPFFFLSSVTLNRDDKYKLPLLTPPSPPKKIFYCARVWFTFQKKKNKIHTTINHPSLSGLNWIVILLLFFFFLTVVVIIG